MDIYEEIVKLRQEGRRGAIATIVNVRGSIPSFKTAKIFTVTAAGGAKPIAGTGLSAVAVNAFKYTMPAQSITVIVPAP